MLVVQSLSCGDSVEQSLLNRDSAVVWNSIDSADGTIYPNTRYPSPIAVRSIYLYSAPYIHTHNEENVIPHNQDAGSVRLVPLDWHWWPESCTTSSEFTGYGAIRNEMKRPR